MLELVTRILINIIKLYFIYLLREVTTMEKINVGDKVIIKTQNDKKVNGHVTDILPKLNALVIDNRRVIHSRNIKVVLREV